MLKPALLCLSLIAITDPVFAEEQELNDVYCTIAPRAGVESDLTMDVKLHISDWKITSAKSQKISFSMNYSENSPVEDFAPYGVFSFFSIANSDVDNIPYTGRVYKDYVKFPLRNKNNERPAGNADYDSANLIISTDYTVVARHEGHNYWTPEWKWINEIRQYPAVLDLSLSDHHGDYVPLKCLGRQVVDEVRP